MDEKTREALIRRSRDGLQSGRPELAERVQPSPVSRYADPVRFAQERQLFLAYPLPLCAATQLARAGDWIATTALEIPVIACRGPNGQLRAFLNVCRHRGAELVPAGRGSGRERFQCPYHAWTYACDGRLTGVPKEWGFPGLDWVGRGLRELAVGEHGGLVWVIVDVERSDQRIDLLLEPLSQELEVMGFGQYVPYGMRTFSLQANWKLVVDGTLEAYHFKIAHRQTIAPLFADNLQVVDEFGLNRRLYLVRELMRTRMAESPTMEVVRACGSLLYHFFPGTLLLIHSDHAQFLRVLPTSPGTCEIHDFTFIPEPPANAQAEAHWKRNLDLFRTTLGEDYALMESIQRGVASKANESYLFGRFEQVSARFEDQIEQALLNAVPRAGGRAQ